MTKDEIKQEIMKNKSKPILRCKIPFEITSVNSWEYLCLIVEKYGYKLHMYNLYIPSWYAYKLLINKIIIQERYYGVSINIYKDELDNLYSNKSYLYIVDIGNNKNSAYLDIIPIMEP